jgi:thioester reductase-like protein
VNESFGSHGPIVLTGATGFLGRAVLAELLDKSDVQIVGLIRANSHAEAHQRGHKTLIAALDREPLASERDRVSWLRADIEETRLGLNTADWNQLANSVGEVIHCAASVRFDLDLAEAHRINVDGTRNILEIATEAKRRGSFGCFHHVSTAYVAGHSAGLSDAAYLPADRAGNFRNSYERTKARAERLLREQNEVPVAIYRPSIVGGNTETGFTDNWNVLYVPMRMIAKGQLPVLPVGGEQLVDTVGVDYVAAAIVHLAIHHSNSNRRKAVGYHLTAGPEPFTVAQFANVSTRLARLFDNEPSTPELVPPARWKLLTSSVAAASKAPKKAKRLRRWGRLGVRGLKGFAPYAPYTCVSSRFENNWEQEILEAACIKMPSPLTYLETIGTYAIGTDFGRDPITAHYSPDEELIS